MSGADQPVLVHRVELDALSIFKDFRPTYKRNVVIVNNIKTLFQNLLNSFRLKTGISCLLRGKRGEKAKWTFKAVYMDIRMIIITLFRLIAC